MGPRVGCAGGENPEGENSNGQRKVALYSTSFRRLLSMAGHLWN